VTNLLAEGVLLRLNASVIVIEGLLEYRGVETHLLGQSITAIELLHQTTADVVLAMPLDLARRLAVENKTDGVLLVLPHLAGDVVTVLKLIDETLAGVVEKKTTDSTESLGGEELDLCVRLVRVNKAGRVYLDFFEIDGVGTDGEGHLVTVTSAVVAIGGRKLVVFRAVLLEERVLGEVGSVSAGGKDDRAVGLLSLSLDHILNPNNGTERPILDELSDTSLLLDFNTIRDAGSQILETLELGIGDGLCMMGKDEKIPSRMWCSYHAGKLGVATVCTGLGVATKTGHLGEVESEPVLQPVHGVTRTTGKNTNEIVSCKFTSLGRISYGVRIKEKTDHVRISWCPRRKSLRCRVHLPRAESVCRHR
jgi:hypothetical protein